MKLLSIEYIPGVEFEALGIVKGTVVQTKNVGKDFMAGMKTLVGGEITGYSQRDECGCCDRCEIWLLPGNVRGSRSYCIWNCCEI